MTAGKITIAGADVICSGNVVSFGTEPVAVYPFGDNNYKIEFTFITDSSRQGQAIRFLAQAPDHFRIELINFQLVGLPNANTEPIHVANRQGKKIFLNFVTQLIGTVNGGIRTLSFTIVEKPG